MSDRATIILSIAILVGLTLLGYQLGDAALDYKRLDRTVVVKGLSEREAASDAVIWPIQFTLASSDLDALYADIEAKTKVVSKYLDSYDISGDAVTVSPPAVLDKSAQAYSQGPLIGPRYVATQTLTVYSEDVQAVRRAMSQMTAIGKQGVVVMGDAYQTRAEYLYTGLNDLKPGMIEEATIRAREVGKKFAADSGSRLGKIKSASQGQFSVSPRDANNPHIKNIRVVSTIEYYLAD